MNLWRQIRPYVSASVRFLHISYIEAKYEHAGTRLGIAWTPLSPIIFSALLALVFRHSDAVSVTDYFLYVYCGYVLWSFISESLTGSTDIIQSRLDFAVHNNLSVFGLFTKTLMDRIFDYLLNAGVLLLLIAVLRPSLISMQIVLFPALLVLIIVASLSGAYLVNIITVLYPDMKTAVKVGARLMFFASPVFWSVESSHGTRAILSNYNPIAYYLAAARQTFGVHPADPYAWFIASAVSCLLGLVGYIVYVRSQTFVRNFK